MKQRYKVSLITLACATVFSVLLAQHSRNTFKPFMTIGGSLASYGRNVADDRVMVGESHYIFVGKILAKTSEDLVDGIPATQYLVKIISNVKGVLHDNVTVAQMGVRYYDGKLTSYEGDTPLITGATYLFATQYGITSSGERQVLYAISAPPYDRELITEDATLSDTELMARAEGNSRVKAFEMAYPNELPSKGEVEGGTNWNNYQSFLSGHLLTPPPVVSSPIAIPPSSSTSYNEASDATSPSPTSQPAISSPETIQQARDSRRIGDIRQLQLALSLYFKDHQGYPTNIDVLMPQYLGPTLRDPSTGDRYGYATNGSKYVLSTKLEDPVNPYLGSLNDKQLGTDLDGMQLGVNCDDPVYCVGG
jgi:hypothetical protein